ncbi:hypothetical protein AgCh_036166 [Apium graveolens]
MKKHLAKRKKVAKRKEVYSGKSFTDDLPEEIMAYILSKNPIETIILCNGVCKKWRRLLSEPLFANLHLSRSPAGLIIYQPCYFEEFNIYNLAEVDNTPHPDIHDGPVISFDLENEFVGEDWPLCGSVNGLICLKKDGGGTCICNPITREYIRLPRQKYIRKSSNFLAYGFGFVKVSHEFKVVCFYEHDFSSTEGLDKLWCEVYTLGTGMWRSLGQVPFLAKVGNRDFLYDRAYNSWNGSEDGVFMGSNLHWLVNVLDTNQERVCTFDLKNEVYQLTAPPRACEKEDFRRLGVLGDSLCVCDNTAKSGLIIWVMKDYEMKESWSKEIIIQERCPPDHSLLYGRVHPLKVFKDGTLILLALKDYQAQEFHVREGLGTLDHQV